MCSNEHYAFKKTNTQYGRGYWRLLDMEQAGYKMRAGNLSQIPGSHFVPNRLCHTIFNSIFIRWRYSFQAMEMPESVITISISLRSAK